jgi:hypothetical protein
MKKITQACFLLSLLVFLFSLNTIAQNEMTSEGITGPKAVKEIVIDDGARGTTAVGDVITSIVPQDISPPWGVGYDRSTNLMYITDAYISPTTIFQLDPATGNKTGVTITINVGQSWIGDMAVENGYLYAVMVGGPNTIEVVDLSTGNVVNSIGGVFTSISQRGLAYDPVYDVFFIGGWNEDIIYRLNGTGGLIDQFSFSGVSGLEWHPQGGPAGQGSLWVVTNASTDIVAELDPNGGWVTLQSFNLPGSNGYAGAGLALNSDGNLWMPNQTDDLVYLVDIQEPLTPMEIPLRTVGIVIAVILIAGWIVFRRGKLF